MRKSALDPAQMQRKLVDWHLEDPKGKQLEQVRRIRDEIERNVLQFFDRRIAKATA